MEIMLYLLHRTFELTQFDAEASVSLFIYSKVSDMVWLE